MTRESRLFYESRQWILRYPWYVRLWRWVKRLFGWRESDDHTDAVMYIIEMMMRHAVARKDKEAKP